MPDIRGWIRQQRYGGVTGLSQTRAQVKILLLALIPMAFILAAAQSMLPEEFKGLSSIMALVGELVVIVFVFMRASINVVKLVPLPSAHTHFPDGQVIPFDFKIQPNGIRFVCDFPDKSKGYELQFTERYEHKDPKLPYPYIFDTMYLRTFPNTDFDHAVQQVSEAEVFHENMFVTHPRCDFITIYIKKFQETPEGFVPVATIASSSYSYKLFLEEDITPSIVNKDSKKPVDLNLMALKDAERKSAELQRHNNTLEIALEVEREQKGRKYRDDVNETVNTIREGVNDVNSTQESWTSRLWKLKWGWLIIGIGVALLFYLLFFWKG